MQRRRKAVFARHGETTSNVSGIHQGTAATLTQKGITQVAHVAAEFERRGVTALLSSGETRAIQSVMPASGRLGLTPEINELFNERKRPSVTVGLHANSSIDQNAMSLVNSGLRFSDEESIRDLLTRGHMIFRMLEEHPSECVGIFSHAHILRALHTIVSRRFNAMETHFKLAYDTLRLDNGGICVFEYAPGHKASGWWWHIVSWNETGHLR